MVVAFDIRALGTASHIGREVSFEEAFMDTFDQAVTPPATKEPFEAWCDWFGVQVEKLNTETDIMIGMLAFCPFLSHPDYRGECRQEILALIEERYEAAR